VRTLQKAISLFVRANSFLGKYGVVIFIASLLLFSGRTFARTAACTCSPCTCSPCTCGGSESGKRTSSGSGKTTPGKNTSSKTTSNKSEPGQKVSKQHEGRREREGGHGGVEVGLNVDLGGVGQRKAEPNPFATNAPPSSQTQEKPKTKKIDKSIDTTFDKVELTTAKAKEHEKPDPFAQVELTGEKGKGQSTPVPVDQTTKP
jgi:hypothetical protein